MFYMLNSLSVLNYLKVLRIHTNTHTYINKLSGVTVKTVRKTKTVEICLIFKNRCEFSNFSVARSQLSKIIKHKMKLSDQKLKSRT